MQMTLPPEATLRRRLPLLRRLRLLHLLRLLRQLRKRLVRPRTIWVMEALARFVSVLVRRSRFVR